MLLKVRKVSTKRVLKSSFLFMLVGVIAFASFQPDTTFRLLANINGQKPKNPSVLNAQKVDFTPALLSTESVAPVVSKSSSDTSIDHELVDKRTEFSSTFINKNGSKTLRHSLEQQNYKDGNTWKKIDNAVNPTSRDEPFGNDLLTLKTSASPGTKAEFKGRAGKLSTTMKSSANGLEIKVGEKTLVMTPVGAKNVLPEKSEEYGVVYKDVWPHVDLRYELRGENVKEVIVLKSKEARTSFDFKVSGGKVINHPTKEGYLTVEGVPEEFSFSQLTLDVNGQGIYSWPPLTQHPTKDGIKIVLDGKWAKSQPKSSFPMAIDPSFGREATNWMMYKSDGYSCNGSVCHANTGTINNNGWKHWRTYFHFPYSDLAGKRILGASFYGVFQHGKGGTGDGRWLNITHANCLGFHCTGPYAGSAVVGTDFRINFAERLQEAINAGNYGAWWSINGEEGPYMSFKPYYTVYADVVYDTPTPVATPSAPSNGQVVVTTEANTLRVNPIGDADGDAVQYYFRVATSSDAESGAVINSDWISASQWTIPDGILQDGTTYYWHVYTRGATQTNPNWVNSFKVDLRTGKDSTQAYDTIGVFEAGLATGNLTTESKTHSMKALGGDIGLSLNYSTTAKVNGGLVGEYWNVSSGYSFASGAPNSTPNLTRNDQDINFDWSTSSPGPGVNADWFYARWKGNFVAPTTGTYNFGATIDDNVAVYVNNQKVFEGGCCGGPIYTNSTGVSLQAGQAVPIRVEFLEAVGAGYVKLYAKTAVPEQIVPRNWLRTDVQASLSQYGLMGRYYKDESSHTLPTNAYDPERLLMARVDSKMTFSWPDGVAPASGLPSDFMARWTGYITVPTTGSYQLRINSDDGVRIRLGTGIGGADQTVLDSWGYTADDRLASAVTLTQGVPTRITIDFFDGGGPGKFTLMVNGGGVNGEIPVKWLSPKANVLPDSWRLGLDVEGSVRYERLRVAGQNIVLEDSSRMTYEYTWTGSGYKPSVNEDGHLVRNANNTYTLLDVDGRTYVFDAEGKLISLTSPSDDRNPAGLKYQYSGDPARLVKITDGVTNTRYGTLHYKSINEDGNCAVPGGFDAAPDGMLCAFKTSDGDSTMFLYKGGQLSRIVKPGNEAIDYGYDSLGRILNTRDSLANDAIAAGIRTDDNTVLTEVTYDILGRVGSIKAPAPTIGATRFSHTLSYAPSRTDMNVTGATEPNGFSKRIQYDNLLRTISETDLTGKTTLVEWDPVKDLQLSTTDATGLKSTTIYDNLDRAIDNYGPAPAAWFETSGPNVRKPLAAYASQVPRSSTGYDENIKGFATSWYNLASTNMTMIGAPKYINLGYSNPTDPAFSATGNTRFDYRTGTLPITPDTSITGVDGYGIRASGRITFPTTGTYTFKTWADDSIRMTLDDKQIFSNWGTKTEGVAQNVLTGTFNAVAGNSYRVMIEYGHTGTPGAFDIWLSGAGITDASGGQGLGVRDWTPYISPAYNLTTSATAYDSYLGNVTTTTQYSNAAYGQVSSTTLDPSGLNYVSQATYEAPGGGYLRQTSKTLPGGGTTTYQHYTASETRDNPCTPEVEVLYQAGRSKGKVEADPDGAGEQAGRRSETVYNASGEIVATRYNDDPWVCTTYDERGRVLQTIIPTIGSKAGRVITNNYAFEGNPLITSTDDGSGTIIVENDLLGRTIKYTDAKGKVTENTYDVYGKLIGRTSVIGTETYQYDNFDRLTVQKLDGVTFATVTYDQYSRLATVQYPAGVTLSNIGRDVLGRENSTEFIVNGQTLTDTIERYVSGDIKQGTENGVSKQYSYDNAGRLTGAVIGSNTFAYEFGSSTSSCSNLPGYNVNTSKNGNRTKLTMNGQVTTYCYDMADRLISSSDQNLTDVQYDTRGNTLSLGDSSHKTEFSYDASDRNVGVKAGEVETKYTRDAQDRIIGREQKVNNSVTSRVTYGFTGSGDSPDFLLDESGDVLQKYIMLPGDVLVTIKPQSNSAGATTYSLPNIHGDIYATVNADGQLISTHATGPFGETLPNQIMPNNTTSGTTWNYVGQHQKLTDFETSNISGGIIQMGARVYIPTLGRFMSMDPIEGAGDNSYAYVNDPVNEDDLDGKIAPLIAVAAWQLGRIAVQQTVKIAVQHAAKQAVQQVAKKTAVQMTKKVTQKATVKMTAHAQQRAIARNITMKDIRGTITNGVKFKYNHGGVRKTGYYNPQTRIFVAARGKKVLTVINNVNRNYINNIYRGR